MSTVQPGLIRKTRADVAHPTVHRSGCIDLNAGATFSFSAEDSQHPLENILDDRSGPGGSFWASDRENTVETIVLRFDKPQTLSWLTYEVEERTARRTQEVRIEVSDNSGVTFRVVLMQQFNFSPGGATFQREDIRLQETGITDVRLTLTPHYDGTGKATLTSLRLYP
jgi:hypothetical protein